MVWNACKGDGGCRKNVVLVWRDRAPLFFLLSNATPVSLFLVCIASFPAGLAVEYNRNKHREVSKGVEEEKEKENKGAFHSPIRV